MIHRKLKANFTEYFLKDASRDTEKKEILSYRKNISWNQLFSNFIIKNGTFTKFLSKMYERISHTICIWEITEFYCHILFAKIPSN